MTLPNIEQMKVDGHKRRREQTEDRENREKHGGEVKPYGAIKKGKKGEVEK